MIETIWTFRVKPECRREFEQRYGEHGDWAKLFARAAGYGGTRLYQDVRQPGRYATVDKWLSTTDMERFKKEFAADYQRLDIACESLTESEEHVGVFESVQ